MSFGTRGRLGCAVLRGADRRYVGYPIPPELTGAALLARRADLVGVPVSRRPGRAGHLARRPSLSQLRLAIVQAS